jgi:hypothetical protein
MTGRCSAAKHSHATLRLIAPVTRAGDAHRLSAPATAIWLRRTDRNGGFRRLGCAGCCVVVGAGCSRGITIGAAVEALRHSRNLGWRFDSANNR